MRLEIEIEITIADKGAQNGTDFVGFIIGVSTGTCAGVHWKSLTTLVRYGGYEVGWIWVGGGGVWGGGGFKNAYVHLRTDVMLRLTSFT